jgi:hypothetical protein
VDEIQLSYEPIRDYRVTGQGENRRGGWSSLIPQTGLTGPGPFHPGDFFPLTSRTNPTNISTRPAKNGTSIAVMESFCATVKPFQNCVKFPARAYSTDSG